MCCGLRANRDNNAKMSRHVPTSLSVHDDPSLLVRDSSGGHCRTVSVAIICKQTSHYRSMRIDSKMKGFCSKLPHLSRPGNGICFAAVRCKGHTYPYVAPTQQKRHIMSSSKGHCLPTRLSFRPHRFTLCAFSHCRFVSSATLCTIFETPSLAS